MNKLDLELLGRVERALKLTFKEWQRNYILDIPMVLDLSITARHTGKTLAYVVKLLLTEGEPIKLYDIKYIYSISDDYHNVGGRHSDVAYSQWFRNYLVHIHTDLIAEGIETRKVFYSKQEYDEYERMINNVKQFRFKL